MNDDCLKLTTYFSERHRTEHQFVADALLDLYGRREVEVSVMLRGAEGFGLTHHLRTDRILTLSEDLPLVSVAVDTRPRIECVLEEVVAIKRHGLITLERARMLTGDVGAVALPEELHEATKLTIYVGRQERVAGAPAFVAVCDLLHRRGIAGATALLGVDGTAHGVRQRARFFGRNAEVPMMIIAVGAGEEIARVVQEPGGLLERPLLALERVTVCKRDGQLPRSTDAAPGDRRAGSGDVAETDGVRVRAGAPRPEPAARGAGAPPARERREWSDLPPRRVGLPRRPCATRGSTATATAPRSGGDDHRRHARADRGFV